MLWQYILSIKLNDNVIYKKDLHENEICVQNNTKELGDKNNKNYILLPNVEV